MGELNYKTDVYMVAYYIIGAVVHKILNKENDEEIYEESTIDDLVSLEDDNYLDDFDFDDIDEEEIAAIEEENQARMQEKENLQALELLHFLIDRDSKYDVVFEEVKEQMEYPFIKDEIFYKYIIILLIVSESYQGIFYDSQRGIADIDERIMKLYEDILDNPDKIFEIFQEEQYRDTAIYLINKFLDYYYVDQYTRNTMCLELIKEKGKFSKLLRMNPFEIFNYLHSYGMEELTESEITIQNFRDAYDYASLACYEIEADEEGRMQFFLEKLQEYYHNDIDKLNAAIAYLFGNLYENFSIHSTDEQCIKLRELIEDNVETLDDLIIEFKTNNDFFWTMLEYFYSFNHILEPNDLALLRWNFKTGHGNVKVLKKLNVYYEQEEKLFATDFTTADE